jgi:hypothetical protein
MHAATVCQILPRLHSVNLLYNQINSCLDLNVYFTVTVSNHFPGRRISRQGPADILGEFLVSFHVMSICAFWAKDEVYQSKPRMFYETEQQDEILLLLLLVISSDKMLSLSHPRCRNVCKMLGPVFRSDVGWLRMSFKTRQGL